MAFETLVSPEALAALRAAGTPLLLLDCAADLADPEAGHRAFLDGHLPGARHAHLERDLSGRPSGNNGRHPLPGREALAGWLRAQGLEPGMQVVAYDAAGGMWASRAWWLLKWLGHAEVAVLDGGRQAWEAAGGTLESGEAGPAGPGRFAPGDPLVAGPVDAEALVGNLAGEVWQVLDARDPARFAGAANALDPVGGHIPGARNRWFKDNLGADGRFREPAALAAEFEALAGGKPVVLSCGSGVSACHNALAMAHAGLRGARLYPGSWSEWTSDPTRPLEQG